MNEPAIQFRQRLSAFQQATTDRTRPIVGSNRTVQPPPRYCLLCMESAVSANNSGDTTESASVKTSQSPEAAAAPLFRAREIWLIGSNTTLAPCWQATSAVRSVELLSHTISSLSQPRSAKTACAVRMPRRAWGRSFSSLNAGTMTEIFRLSS